MQVYEAQRGSQVHIPTAGPGIYHKPFGLGSGLLVFMAQEL